MRVHLSCQRNRRHAQRIKVTGEGWPAGNLLYQDVAARADDKTLRRNAAINRRHFLDHTEINEHHLIGGAAYHDVVRLDVAVNDGRRECVDVIEDPQSTEQDRNQVRF